MYENILLICALVLCLSYLIYFVYKAIKHEFLSYKCMSNYGKTGLVIIALKNNDKEFNFIVDSGSTISVLNKRYAKELSTDIKFMPTAFGTVNGEKSSSEYITVPLFGKYGLYTVKFHLLDLDNSFPWDEDELGKKVHGILGMDFLVQNNFVIDFERLKMYIK